MRLRLAIVALFALTALPRASGYVEAPMSLGAIVNQSTTICVMQVTKVDKSQNLIIYQKVQDLKGKHPQESIKHTIKQELKAGEIKEIMNWAEPGKLAIFFNNGSASETCTGMNWYQCYPQGEWWGMTHSEPFLLRSYAGKIDKLGPLVTELLAGREALAPCMVDGNKEELHRKVARIQRLKVSLKLQDYNPKRDFGGWGGEDIRRIAGMPGFSQFAALGRVDADAQAIAPIDFDGDGKLDLCLCSTRRVLLLQNQGDSFSEVFLPGLVGGSRACVWADCNGDGRPDLLLATPRGPRLYANLGSGQFRDDTATLPVERCYDLTGAAWLDADGDGKPDIVLANGFHGLKLYRNLGAKFKDVTTEWGLGDLGESMPKGGSITAADFNGDGKTDLLYAAGNGMLFINHGKRFELSSDHGLKFDPARAGPVPADFTFDGQIDLAIPQADRLLLFHNEGKGKFSDISNKSGDLSRPIPGIVSVAWGDINNDGKLDLIVGCLRSGNRYFENNGDRTFTEKSAALGLTQRVFNSKAIALADLNDDGRLDLIMANEGQDSAVLFGNKELSSSGQALTVAVNPAHVGSTVRVLDRREVMYATQQILGGEARGGQPGFTARMALPAGDYRVENWLNGTKILSRDVTIRDAPVRIKDK